jgi:hypothetical protein
MGRRPAGSLKAYPFDLFQRTRCYVMLHEIEKDGFCRISRNWEGSLPRTQNQKTKRTQFGPLFSTKLQDGYVLHSGSYHRLWFGDLI